MPVKSKKRPSQPAEDYSSDGGFVANDSGDDRPRPKKAKSGKQSARGAERSKGEKGEGKDVPGGGGVGASGEEFWELSGKRRVGVSEYNGKLMVSIREYYDKDGESLPSKKGISLPIDQFNTLVSLLPHVEAVLQSKGAETVRPEYEGVVTGGADAETDEIAAENGKEEKEEKVRRKKNFEETSEEEEE